MAGILDLKSWLEHNHPFLEESDIEFFRPFLVEKGIDRDDYVLKAGERCRELSFIATGVFRMFCILDGKEVNIHFFTEHEFMADFGCFLSQSPGRYYIQALEKAQLVSFGHDILSQAYDRSKNWERLGRLMAERFACMVTDRLEKFLFMDGMERYLCLLRENPGIFDRVPLYHLASYLGMERETLSRIRQRLSKGGRM
ncbi:MAG: Crp/Fnr family transcriptional regulator [Chlorobiaceae bacterium]|nr:Crp/Fnr family transcriptional regulator [Chlorobiaceae bacterium]